MLVPLLGIAVSDLGEFVLIDRSAIVAHDALNGSHHAIALFSLVNHWHVLQFNVPVPTSLDMVPSDKALDDIA